ncbi:MULTISPECIES: FMN-binding negative transcriptional regulator [unclassified Bradyrhizobium]|uniref:FMN-binding negative transcriptional regulator n=1 Tax=unclassified Bradyrhizobium TaxID=2631580 RepID=UPI001CD69E38|nr:MULTISPECIES: FMN-binding negative transcriptional regulator [unclassified Bradyrhizobium]MCA1384321.1 FMN-binding negative transcriptional regulator [Bradyrhizobium sp. BRP05]MCA1392735.1 FMN-binding negative transcriptional regulator [Bradyrhizobium sp. IC3123]MCA1421062.1 FMN-binding negative transcriptional regulator [Bradyrhizobium sp. BRP23]MCA1428432.1 FMN-binding negative transcriptional regulator [Bradyrhizobium sp. NBAIM16]MCA1479350.1 FMN-binding negative transcriptional regulato
MYIPSHFRDDDLKSIQATIRCARLANLITATSDGPLATPLPLFLDESEGKHGALYGHLAKGNPQWRTAPIGEALAIFSGAEAYVTPSWYPSKRQTEHVVPTWNYIAVHAHGPIEFFEDPKRLLEIVTRLTNIHETSRATPWAVSDAPADFIAVQLREIAGVRIPITMVEGKRKMSQNRPAPDRVGVATGLAASKLAQDLEVAALILAQD